MKLIKTILFVLCTLQLSGCAYLQEYYDRTPYDFYGLRPGMTTTDVVSVLGHPRVKKWNGYSEAWQYCEESFLQPSFEYAVVWLRDNMVVNVRKFNNNTGEACEAFFATFNWIEEPADSPGRTAAEAFSVRQTALKTYK